MKPRDILAARSVWWGQNKNAALSTTCHRRVPLVFRIEVAEDRHPPSRKLSITRSEMRRSVAFDLSRTITCRVVVKGQWKLSQQSTLTIWTWALCVSIDSLFVRFGISIGSLLDFSGSLLNLCWISSGSLLDLYWIFMGSLLDLYWISLGSILYLCWTSNGSLLDLYRIFMWSLLDLY